MSTAELYRDDWQHDETVEDVTFTVSASSTAVAGVKASQTDLDFREAIQVGGGASEPTVIVWIIWDATLGNNVPKRGDTVTDSAGSVWTIQSLRPVMIGATPIKWRAVCVKQ